MEFEFQQQLQQPYFASFPHPSSTSTSSSTYAIPPSSFIEADATPRRKPFPNKVTLTELQQYQEQQQLQVQHHPFPSYSAYPPNFQILYQQALIADEQTQYQYPPQPQYQPQHQHQHPHHQAQAPSLDYNMDIDPSVYASNTHLKQKPPPLRKISNELGFSAPPISNLVAPVYGSPAFFSPTTQSFGDFYQVEANMPHVSQTNVNVDPRQHRHSSYTFSQSQDNLFSYGEPVQRSNSKASKSSRGSRRSKSQYFEDVPSTPVLTVTPRKKRPKSLAAQDFTVGADGLGYSLEESTTKSVRHKGHATQQKDVVWIEYK
ncbi:hypothetical protein BG003_004672 [Podila horticola]|nr:hypothetical protein BG003_004672 [Podila horticola]